MTSINSFLSSYIASALWSSTDENGEPLDASYDSSDLAPATLAEMERECAAFQAENEADLMLWLEVFGSYAQAGHDFWLTRNGHGAGFWDRFSSSQVELYAAGKRLTEASKVYGECGLYVGDDGLIYR